MKISIPNDISDEERRVAIVPKTAAHLLKDGPLYGIPILNADQARTVIICKRSLSPGFSGVDNELFYHEKTLMIFGDAKESINKMIKLLKT